MYSQPLPKIKEATAQAAAKQREALVKGHLGDMVRVTFLEKAPAFRNIEFPILEFNANKKTV